MPTDAIGYLAALLVLAAFCMRDMTALRLLALASNLAFIAYALSAGLQPVLLLHAVLLPVNLWRLANDRWGLAGARGRASAPGSAGQAPAGDRGDGGHGVEGGGRDDRGAWRVPGSKPGTP